MRRPTTSRSRRSSVRSENSLPSQDAVRPRDQADEWYGDRRLSIGPRAHDDRDRDRDRHRHRDHNQRGRDYRDRSQKDDRSRKSERHSFVSALQDIKHGMVEAEFADADGEADRVPEIRFNVVRGRTPKYDVRVLLRGLRGWDDVVRLNYDEVSGDVALRLASHAAVRYFKRYYDGGYIEWSRPQFESASRRLSLTPTCTLPGSRGELQHLIADRLEVNWRSVLYANDGAYTVFYPCVEMATRAMKRWYEELDAHRIDVPVALYLVDFVRSSR